MNEFDAMLTCSKAGCDTEVLVEEFLTLEADSAYRRIIETTVLCEPHLEESEAASVEEERQKRRAAYANAVSYAYLPKALKGLKWADYDTEESEDVLEGERVIATASEASSLRQAAIASAKSWAAGEIHGLVLAGRVGIGKTRLAGIAAQDFIYHRIKGLSGTALDRPIMPIRWVSVPELIHKAKGEFGSDRRRDAEKIIGGNNALVLDDLDKVKPTEIGLDLLFEAIEGRTNSEKPLLVTTNMRYPELEKHLGHPIASRIAGYCEGARMVGDDRRVAF